MQHQLTNGDLLDDRGVLCEAGYATSLLKKYSRKAITASPLRIKEWDYYLIYNNRFAVALTLDNNSYMSMLSASFIDFTVPCEKTVSPMGFMPLGSVKLPSSSESGVSNLRLGKSDFLFQVKNGIRHLQCHLEKFQDGQPFDADLLLTDAPRDSMVIATPFENAPKAFYYNQKIIGMRASGWFSIAGERFELDPAETFGLLDWGRGVWTYDNTWYWGAGQGIVDGHVIGFNIGYGFGDVSAASENMVFVDGIAHKLDRLTFNIPKTADGRDDFMKPWTFTSSDGRFEMDFVPIIDRASCTNALVILSDQHQVFGKFTGKIILDDGTVINLNDFIGFAEKVRNKW